MTGSFSADSRQLNVAAEELRAYAEMVASAQQEFDQKAYLPDSALTVFAKRPSWEPIGRHHRK